MISGVKDCARTYVNKFGGTLVNAEEQIKKVVSVISNELVENEGVRFMGNFSIKKVTRKERMGRNPSTGEEFIIPQKNALKIVVGKELDAKINE